MMVYDMFFFLACRGIGKTYLVSLFCVCRCILYPGSKIVCTAPTFKQGKEIILKITDDFMQKSPFLRNEIEKWSTGQNDCFIMFKGGSWMRVYVASDNARGARSNVIIGDERRMITKDIIDRVFRPMNSSPRQPGYLNKPEYAHLQEMNKEIYMSSAWYAASEMFDDVKAYTANFLSPGLSYFICDLPYELSIKEGLLMRQQIVNEMAEQTFNSVTFAMEREGLFWGSAEDALFDFKILDRQRVIVDSLHDLAYYRDNNLRIPDKDRNELRILSVDIALMASKKHSNDASALIIHSAVPTANFNYLDNIVYIETQEGLVTDELGLLVMRFYYQYNCDYIVLDANGSGLSVADFLMADRYDPLYGQTYHALNCMNDDNMASRCKIAGAPKVIYAMKANAKLNNDMALGLRSGFQNGYINLLVSDNNIEEKLSKIRGYSKLSDLQQARLKLPYIQTTFLIDELINLSHDVSNGLIKVKEKSGMRKDRYSSLEYGYYFIQELSRNLKPKSTSQELLDLISVKGSKSRFNTKKRY